MNGHYALPEEDSIDLSHLLLRIAQQRRRWLLAVCLFLGLGVFYLLITPPVYEIEASLYINRSGLLQSGGSSVEAEAERLGSWHMLEGAFDRAASADKEEAVTPSQRKELIHRLKTDLEITTDKAGQLVKLRYAHRDPEWVERLMRTLISLYFETLQTGERQGHRYAKDFLERQMAEALTHQQKAQDALEAFLKDNPAGVQEEGGALLLEQLMEIERKQQDMLLEKARADILYTEQHATSRMIQNQIGQLEESKRALEDRITRLPTLQQRFLLLKRDVEFYAKLKPFYLEKLNEMMIESAAERDIAQLVNAPARAEKIWPKPFATLFVAALFGGVMGFFYILLLESSLFRRIKTASDAKEITSLPVLASLPERKQIHEPALGGYAQALECMISETPHAVCALLSLTHDNHRDQTEWLSRLRHSLPEGYRFLLVDAQWENHGLHRYFRTAFSPGLSGAVVGKHALRDAVQRLSEHIDFLPSGQRPPDPALVTGHPAFASGMRGLAKRYDLVLLNLPSLQHAPSALKDSAFADRRILHLSYNQPMHAVKRFLAEAGRCNCALHGVALTGLPGGRKELQKIVSE